VGPALYMETIAALKPDLYVTLCDEVTADARPKRVAASTKRTTAWLDTCLQLHEQYSLPQEQQQQQQGQAGQQQPGDGGGPLAGSLLLAALAGGALPAERARAAAAVADKPGVQGARFVLAR
ncbi:Queuine tRNA-ribosyltransferase subunit QTRTD1, partial [Tetrabaena socialis]